MPAARNREILVAALADEFDHLLELGDVLSEAEWKMASDVPGWTVKDNYSHIIGTELMLLGRPDEGDPVEAAHVNNDIGRFNEVSVALRRDRSGAEVLAELATVTEQRRDALAAMSDADFDAESFTPAGKDTYGRFMQIRVFDCWIHEQDCRGPVGITGHLSGPAVDVSLDEMTTAMGYVIGKLAGATEGQSVRLQLLGETERVIDVRVDGRAAVVDDLTDPTTTVTVPTALWFRFAAGRIPGEPDHHDVEIKGDRELGRAVVENAAYTI